MAVLTSVPQAPLEEPRFRGDWMFTTFRIWQRIGREGGRCQTRDDAERNPAGSFRPSLPTTVVARECDRNVSEILEACQTSWKLERGLAMWELRAEGFGSGRNPAVEEV